MRFLIVVRGGPQHEAEGVPPDESYPEWFVTDNGWIYPVSAVQAFRPLKGRQA